MIPLIAAAGALDAAGKVATAATTLTKAIFGKTAKDSGSGNAAVNFADLVASHGAASSHGDAWRMPSNTVSVRDRVKSKEIDQIA